MGIQIVNYYYDMASDRKYTEALEALSTARPPFAKLAS